MAENKAIGSITQQWGRIGAKKEAGTPNNPTTQPPEQQDTNKQDDKDTRTANRQKTSDLVPSSPEQSGQQDTSNSVVQTTGSLNNELTEPQNDQDLELPDYQWTDDPEDEGTSVSNDLPAGSAVNKVTRNLGGKATRGRVPQSSNTPNKQATNVKVVQYVRKVKPERLRQTVYLYPDVLRWVKRRIAETDEEISDVANYTVQLCMWLEEKHPDMLAKFERQR